MKPRSTVALLVAVATALGGLAWPWTEEVVPRWTITVKMPDGRPVAGVPVIQAWRHYTVQSRSSTEQGRTDAAGVVEFPPRRITICAARLALGAAGAVLKYWFNASFGPSGQVIIGIDGQHRGCDRLVYSPDRAGPNGMQSECIVEEGFSIRQP